MNAGGGNWVELRAVEAMLNAALARLASDEARIAALEQGQWQNAAAPADPTGGSGYVARARATSNVSTGTVDGPGTGTATLTLSGVPVTVYSIYDKVISTGAGMMLGSENFKWYVLSVDSCNSIINPAAGSESDFFSHQLDTLTASEGVHPAAGRVRGFEEIAGPIQETAATPSRVQQHYRAQGSATSVAVTLTSTAAGNLLVAAYESDGSSVSFPAGWTRAVLGGVNNLAVWYYPNNPGGITSVSVSTAGNCSANLWVAEYSGVPASPTVHTNTSGPTSTSPISSGSVTPTGPAVAVAAFNDDGPSAFSSPSGGFAVVDQQDSADGVFHLAALDKTGAAGAYTAGVAFPGGNTCYAVIASFN